MQDNGDMIKTNGDGNFAAHAMKEKTKIGIIHYKMNSIRKKYQGEVNGISPIPQGRGLLIYKDGRKYIGQFRDHFPAGEGAMYSKDGSVLRRGTFENLNGFYYIKENQQRGGVTELYFDDDKVAQKSAPVQGMSETRIFDAEGQEIRGYATFVKHSNWGWGLCMRSENLVFFSSGNVFEGDFLVSQVTVSVELKNGSLYSYDNEVITRPNASNTGLGCKVFEMPY